MYTQCVTSTKATRKVEWGGTGPQPARDTGGIRGRDTGVRCERPDEPGIAGAGTARPPG